MDGTKGAAKWQHNGLRTNRTTSLRTVCGKPINLDEDGYCTDHEEECPNYGLEDQAEDCECSVFYHENCCPICLSTEKAIREYEQHRH